MKYLITGSSGFIGTHLRERLKDEDVVRVPRAYLSSPVKLNKLISASQPDYIIHLASYGNHYFQTDQKELYSANIDALHNLLEASMGYPYKGFFNVSTTSHNLEASTFYGSTKSAGEYLVRAFVNTFDSPIVNIRPYSVFGEYEWDFRFIPTLCKQLQKEQPIIVSDVSHDWIYVEDFLDGLLAMREKSQELRGASIGIGTGIQTPNIEIANRLMAISKARVEILKGDKRHYEIANYKQIQEGEKRRDEITYTEFAKTSLEDALFNVYTNQKFLKKI